MRVIAVVEDIGAYNRHVRLVPDGVAYELLGPQPDEGVHVVLVLPGLAELSDPAMTRWLVEHYQAGEHRVPTELFAESYAVATLADFLEAANAQLYFARLPSLFGADAFEQFANAQGSEVLALVRAALDGDSAAASVGARARRFARVLGVERADEVCDELAQLHDVEHLMGIEHAAGRWVAAASRPRTAELAALVACPPADTVSAGISRSWYRWWWGLAWATTRAQLMRAVAAVVAAAEETCATRKPPVAAEARAEARRLVAAMRGAPRADAWSRPPSDAVDPARRDTRHDDLHECAFAAVSHAAHAIAFAHTADGLPYAEASRRAMRHLADLAARTVAE